jgi:hypothetical protein
MYSAAMECAKHEAGTALIHGSMDVDVCQAYLLLAIYAKPKKNWAEDKSWEYIGIAVRYWVCILNTDPCNSDEPQAHDTTENQSTPAKWDE